VYGDIKHILDASNNKEKEGINMRKQIIVLLMVAASLSFVACQSNTVEDPAKVKQEIEKANAAYWGIMLAGDYDKLPSYYADGAVIMPHGNPKMGVDGMIKQQNEGKKMGIKVSSYTPTILDVWSCGDMIYEVGAYEMKASMAGAGEPITDTGSYTCVWVKGTDGSLKRKYFIWNTAVSELSAPPAGTETTTAQPKQTNPFEGNWELLSVTSKGTLVVDGKPVNVNMVKDTKNFGMKMIHNSYFMFSGQDTNNSATEASYGYGTYTFKDNIYTENIIYHVGKELIGKSMSFEMTVKGDTLIQRGPLKIGEFKDITYEITETYVRK
jgi:ketosteroid isomerase-like protein